MRAVQTKAKTKKDERQPTQVKREPKGTIDWAMYATAADSWQTNKKDEDEDEAEPHLYNYYTT